MADAEYSWFGNFPNFDFDSSDLEDTFTSDGDSSDYGNVIGESGNKTDDEEYANWDYTASSWNFEKLRKNTCSKLEFENGQPQLLPTATVMTERLGENSEEAVTDHQDFLIESMTNFLLSDSDSDKESVKQEDPLLRPVPLKFKQLNTADISKGLSHIHQHRVSKSKPSTYEILIKNLEGVTVNGSDQFTLSTNEHEPNDENEITIEQGDPISTNSSQIIDELAQSAVGSESEDDNIVTMLATKSDDIRQETLLLQPQPFALLLQSQDLSSASNLDLINEGCDHCKCQRRSFAESLTSTVPSVSFQAAVNAELFPGHPLIDYESGDPSVSSDSEDLPILGSYSSGHSGSGTSSSGFISSEECEKVPEVADKSQSLAKYEWKNHPTMGHTLRHTAANPVRSEYIGIPYLMNLVGRKHSKNMSLRNVIGCWNPIAPKYPDVRFKGLDYDVD